MQPRQTTESRQAALVAAALALAANRSPATVTTAELAQAVGITQGAVFRHFENKEAIWLAVIADAHQRLLERLHAAAAQHAAPLPALRAVFIAHVDFVVEHPGLPRLVFQELQQPQDTPLKARVRHLMHDVRVLLTRLLQQAQDQQVLHPGTDLPAATVLFVGSVQGLVMQSMLSSQVDAMRQQAPGVFELLQRALAAPRAPHSPQETP